MVRRRNLDGRVGVVWGEVVYECEGEGILRRRWGIGSELEGLEFWGRRVG